MVSHNVTFSVYTSWQTLFIISYVLKMHVLRLLKLAYTGGHSTIIYNIAASNSESVAAVLD